MITLLSVLLMSGLVALLAAGAYLFVHLLPYLLVIGAIIAVVLIIRFLQRHGR